MTTKAQEAVNALLPCESCAGTDGVAEEDSRTCYDWDGKGEDPNNHPSVKLARQQLKDAARNQFKVHVKLGVKTAEDVANEIVGNATGPQDVLKSLGEIADTFGGAYSEQVAKLVDANPVARAMPQRPWNGSGAKSPAARAVAAAPPGSWSLQPGGARPAAVAGTPIALSSARPTTAPVPAAPPGDMERRLATENAEMAAGKRMQYSPDVKAYGDAKQAAKDQAEQAASQEYRNKALSLSQARSRELSGVR